MSCRLARSSKNDRRSGSLCSAAEHDPESVRAGIGPEEPENETRGESV